MTTPQSSPTPVTAPDTTTPSPGVVEDMIRITHELRELAHDHLELAILETRLSVNYALTMTVIAIVAAVLLVSTWLALIGAAALGLISAGLTPAVAMLLLAAGNLLLALVAWGLIRRRSGKLGWPATLRSLKPRASSDRKVDPA